jgi:hypothetical protein
MRYFSLNPYGELEAIQRQYPPPTVCGKCGRSIPAGAKCAGVRFVDPPPYPDAVGVLDGPEWAVSSRLKALLESYGGRSEYAQLVDETKRSIDYHQVSVCDVLRVGRQSVLGGTSCVECGGFVQLNLKPLYLKRVNEGPALATLLESPAVVLIREDVAEQAAQSGIEWDLESTLFDDETPLAVRPTFDGDDWTDLRGRR